MTQIWKVFWAISKASRPLPQICRGVLHWVFHFAGEIYCAYNKEGYGPWSCRKMGDETSEAAHVSERDESKE